MLLCFLETDFDGPTEAVNLQHPQYTRGYIRREEQHKLPLVSKPTKKQCDWPDPFIRDEDFEITDIPFPTAFFVPFVFQDCFYFAGFEGIPFLEIFPLI